MHLKLEKKVTFSQSQNWAFQHRAGAYAAIIFWELYWLVGTTRPF